MWSLRWRIGFAPRTTLDGELSELARGAVGCARQLLQAVSHLTLLAAQLLEHVLRQLLILLPLLVEHLELRGLAWRAS